MKEAYSIVAFENLTRGDRFEDYRQETSVLSYVGAFVVEASNVDEALSAAWSLGNRETGPDAAGRDWPKQRRSMSVGDVVVVEGRAHACEKIGWKELARIPDQPAPQVHQWLPDEWADQTARRLAAEQTSREADRLPGTSTEPVGPASPAAPAPIRIGFVQDYAREEANAEERRGAVQDLEAEIGGEYEVVWFGDAHEMHDMPDVDLLIVDYGGVSTGYGEGWRVYGEVVKDWADEHHGKPVLLWTAHTTAAYRAAFAEFQKEAGNVLARYADTSDWTGYDDLWSRLRGWLGVPEDAPRSVSLHREIEAAGPLVEPDEFSPYVGSDGREHGEF